MRNLVGGVMTPPYESKLLGVTNYYIGVSSFVRG